MPEPRKTELGDLAAALYDGDLTPEQCAELAERLSDDAAAVDAFVMENLILSQLAEQLGGDQLGAEIVGQIERAGDQPLVTTRHQSWLARNSTRGAIAIAATVLVAALLVLDIIPAPNFLARDEDTRGTVKPQEIATLTAWHRPEWVREHAISPRNHRISTGQKVAFTSGMIEITYDTGAKVVIEGPAEFVVGATEPAERARKKGEGGSVNAANGGFLKHGSLVARCETKASQGFTVCTPHACVEDHGTEFGVDVDERGAAEFVVLSGAVDLINGTSDGPQRRIRLVKGQGAFVTAAGGRITQRKNVDVRFVAAMQARLESVATFNTDLVATDLNNGGVDTGFSGEWIGSSNVFVKDASDLRYANYGINQTGATQQVYASNAGPNRQDTRNLATAMSGEIWFSVLVHVPSAGNYAGLTLNNYDEGNETGYNPITTAARILMTPSQLQVGFSGGGLTLGTGSFAADTTHLLLGKMNVAAGRDTLKVWVDPDLTGISGPDELPAANFTSTTVDFTNSITSLGVAGSAGGGGETYIDAIRLSNTPTAFFDVTGVKKQIAPAEPALTD